jgi:hypothetical protein
LLILDIVSFAFSMLLRLRRLASFAENGEIIVARPFCNRRYYYRGRCRGSSWSCQRAGLRQLCLGSFGQVCMDSICVTVGFVSPKPSAFPDRAFFESGCKHATAAGREIGLPVNNRKNTGNFSTKRRASYSRRRTCPAKSRSGSFGRNGLHGSRGLARPWMVLWKARSSQHLSGIVPYLF